jgi:hypothetical protein
MTDLMNPYILCVAAGFMLDKLKVFPFVLGIILGIVLKSLIDHNLWFQEMDISTHVERLYTKLQAAA